MNGVERGSNTGVAHVAKTVVHCTVKVRKGCQERWGGWLAFTEKARKGSRNRYDRMARATASSATASRVWSVKNFFRERVAKNGM